MVIWEVSVYKYLQPPFKSSDFRVVSNLHKFVMRKVNRAMKQNVFLRAWGIPALFIIILAVRLSNGLTPFGVFSNIAFVFSILMVALLRDKRYLHQFSITNGKASLTYTNQFLQTKTDEFALTEIINMHTGGKSSLQLLWPPYLNIRTEEESKDYIITGQEILMQVEREIGPMQEKHARVNLS
jgi:hypothetical protein